MAEPDLPARDRLLAVATRLFTELGYEGTPVSRIVREAGVTMPVLYYHFGKKSELLGAVIAARGQWLRADLKIDASRSFVANCRTMVDHAIEHIAEVRDGLRLRLILGFEAGPEAETLRDFVQEQRGRSVASLAALFVSALPGCSGPRSAWLAEVYLSGVQGLALELIGVNERSPLLTAKGEQLVRSLATIEAMAEDALPHSLA